MREQPYKHVARRTIGRRASFKLHGDVHGLLIAREQSASETNLSLVLSE